MQIAIYSTNQQEIAQICNWIYQCEKTNEQFVIDTFTDKELLLQSNTHYDMIFLDSESLYRQVMSLAAKITKHSPLTMLIFLLADDEEAHQPFHLETRQNLWKPLNEASFKSDFAYYLACCAKLQEYFSVCYKGQLSLLNKNDIVYLKTEKRLITAHLFNGETCCYYGRLIDEEKRFTNSHFVRSHKCHLINLSYVERFNHNSITVTFAPEIGKMILPLSKQRYANMIRAMQWYLIAKQDERLSVK